MRKVIWATLISGMLASTASAADLTIALQDDPDLLDPHLGNTYVGRIIFASLCDKLFEIDTSLNIIPRIVTEWSWSEDGTALSMKLRTDALFHDGTPINAEAVKANLERAMTLPESVRKAELASVESIDIGGEHELSIKLKEADATFLATLADRAGMLVSPASFDKAKDGSLVCSGPFKFVQRVQNDRIVLEKFAEHWEAADYHFDKVTYMPVADSTVRLANLQSGDIHLIERPAPSDTDAIKADPNLAFELIMGLGYYSGQFNMGNGPRSEHPINKDKRLRQALNLAIDRDVINQVLGLGTYQAAYQPFSPSSWAYNPEFDGPKRDVEKAKALMAEAGHPTVSFEMLYPTGTQLQQLFELIQAMAAEAGFTITARPTEFSTYIDVRKQGDFDFSILEASGRVDPDGNLHRYLACGSAANNGNYCNQEVTALLNQARTTADVAQRKALYDKAQAILNDELPAIYIHYIPRTWAYRSSLKNFVPYPDGIIRLKGVIMQD